MGRHLGIDFSWILVDFEGQVGAMLGSKIDQNSIQEGIEKRMRKRKRLGGVLEAPGGGFDASRVVHGGNYTVGGVVGGPMTRSISESQGHGEGIKRRGKMDYRSNGQETEL